MTGSAMKRCLLSAIMLTGWQSFGQVYPLPCQRILHIRDLLTEAQNAGLPIIEDLAVSATHWAVLVSFRNPRIGSVLVTGDWAQGPVRSHSVHARVGTAAVEREREIDLLAAEPEIVGQTGPFRRDRVPGPRSIDVPASMTPGGLPRRSKTRDGLYSAYPEAGI